MDHKSKNKRNKKNPIENDDIPFVKSLSFRANRGSKIKILLEKNEEEDIDDFWKHNKYFGDINELEKYDNDNDEYTQESEEPDVFDEDFAETSSDEDEEEGAEKNIPKKKLKTSKERFRDEMEEKAKIAKKKKLEALIKPKKSLKTIKPTKMKAIKVTGPAMQKKQLQAPGPRKGKYIHDFFTQQQLLQEAPQTELINKKSLEDLVRLETDRKLVHNNRKRKIEGPKLTTKCSVKTGVFESVVYFENKEAYKAYIGTLKTKIHRSVNKKPPVVIHLKKNEDGYAVVDGIEIENVVPPPKKEEITSNLLRYKLKKLESIKELEREADLYIASLKSLLDRKKATLHLISHD